MAAGGFGVHVGHRPQPARRVGNDWCGGWFGGGGKPGDGGCLRERGATLVASETDEAPAALHETARVGYLRLRRTDYRPGDLAEWLARVRALTWDEAYVFFKHEQSGPALAAEFAALAQRGRAIPVRRDERAREAG